MLYVETTNVKVALREADLWQNTGTVTALISADEYASGAALEYRIKGDTEWQPMQESGYDAGILTATIAPEWKTETNPNGLTVYKLVPKRDCSQATPTNSGCWSAAASRALRWSTRPLRATLSPTATWKTPR